MKNNYYICHAPYLKNSVAYDHDFWYTCVKWWDLQEFFSFFKKILIFRAVRKVKEQKVAQNKNKNDICYTPYLRNSIAHDHDFWFTRVKWWYLQDFFFQFFKMLIFHVVRGVKGQKTVQNDKIFCLSYFISQEPYIHHMIVIYGTLV